MVLTVLFIIMCTKVGSEHSPLQTLKKPVFRSLGKICDHKGIVSIQTKKKRKMSILLAVYIQRDGL